MVRNKKNSRTLVGYGITSPLHLANFMSYLLVHRSNYNEYHVFIHQYWNYNIIPLRYIEQCERIGVRFHYDMDYANQKIKDLNKGLDCVFINMPNIGLVVKKFGFLKIRNIIIIDEGLSSYNSAGNNRKAFHRESGRLPSYKKYIVNNIINFLLKIYYHKNYISYPIFNKYDYSINLSYKAGLIDFFNLLGCEGDKKINNKAVIFCAQPWVELNVLKEDEYIANLNKIKNEVEGFGYSLYIKKHPVEKLIDYSSKGFFTLDFDGMLEEFVCYNNDNVVAIISTNSTSSMIIPPLFNVKSYLINFKDVESFGKHAKNIFIKYCLDFSETHKQI